MRTSIEALKEIRDRLTYFCLRTDGRYDPPWATELVGIIDEAVTDSHAFGNAAAMCKALCDIVMLTMKVGHSIHGDVACGIIASKAKRALAAPPRNCDRFGGDGDIDLLRETCLRERGLNPEEDFPEVFCEWLLSKAKGESNGSK